YAVPARTSDKQWGDRGGCRDRRNKAHPSRSWLWDWLCSPEASKGAYRGRSPGERHGRKGIFALRSPNRMAWLACSPGLVLEQGTWVGAWSFAAAWWLEREHRSNCPWGWNCYPPAELLFLWAPALASHRQISKYRQAWRHRAVQRYSGSMSVDHSRPVRSRAAPHCRGRGSKAGAWVGLRGGPPGGEARDARGGLLVWWGGGC